MSESTEAGARQVLERYYQAMRDISADDLADLYAEDAVHEFPFASPAFPDRFEGREQVRAGYRAAWGASPLTAVEVTDVVVHETTDPAVVIAEQVAVGTLPGGRGTVSVPGLLVIRVEGGLIRHVRDYLDGYGMARARESS